MSAAVQIRPRTLEQVLQDIRDWQVIFHRNWGTPHESACLDKLDELQAEARAMVEAATGCDWADLASAGL